MPPLRPTARQRGFTLTEAALVMGVVAIIFSGLWAAGSALNANARNDQALAQLRMTLQTIRDIYGVEYSFSNTGSDVTSLMVNAGAFPTDMLDGTTPKSPWGENVKVYSGNTRTQVGYEWVKLPKESCKVLAGRLGGMGRDEQLVEIRAGATTYSSDNDLDALTATNAPDSCETLKVIYNLR